MSWQLTHCKDLSIIFITKMIRMFGFGTLVLTLIDILYYKDVNTIQISIIQALAVGANILFAIIFTSNANSKGTFKTLILASLLMIMSGLIFTLFKNFFLLALASALGIISVTGNETGPFQQMEQKSLSKLISKVAPRPQTAQRYTPIVLNLHKLAGYVCLAAGIYYAGNYIVNTKQDCHNSQQSFQSLMLTYTILATVMFILYCFLGKQSVENQFSEAQPLTYKAAYPNKIKLIVAYILVGLQSFGGAFIIYPFLAYFYELRYLQLNEVSIINFLVKYCLVGAVGFLLALKFFNCIGTFFAISLQLISSILLITNFYLDHAGLSMNLLYAYIFLASLDKPIRKYFLSRWIPAVESHHTNSMVRVVMSVGLLLGLLTNSAILIQKPFRYTLSLPFLIAGCARILSGLSTGCLIAFKRNKQVAFEGGSIEMSESMEKQ